MREDVIEDTVVNKAEMAGWFVRKVKYIGRRNAADRIFAKNGRIVFLEFKAPGKEPRPGQEREMARMRAAGIEVHTCDSIDHGLKTLGLA